MPRSGTQAAGIVAAEDVHRLLSLGPASRQQLRSSFFDFDAEAGKLQEDVQQNREATSGEAGKDAQAQADGLKAMTAGGSSGPDPAVCKDGCPLSEAGAPIDGSGDVSSGRGSSHAGDWNAQGPGPPAGGGPGPAQVPKTWQEAELAEKAEKRAEELVQAEAQRTGRSFEEVANEDHDDPADDPCALKPRPALRIVCSPGSKVCKPMQNPGWPKPTDTDKWGGVAMQAPLNMHSGPVMSMLGGDAAALSAVLARLSSGQRCAARRSWSLGRDFL
eukprot:TRINITY_DN61623_c0_g1_i1.p1 TRINITY_DN61623_c0_g1~~TRINITY_DN61623_c0_g1_i1.p1  ORF type:complete len:281 (-),score=70.70 TRINITY_DN61623_c0_g1_i1:12-833(-)